MSSLLLTSPNSTTAYTSDQSNSTSTFAWLSTGISAISNSTGMSGDDSAKSITEFYVGLFLAISSSIFIGSSFILKKRALLRLAAKDTSRRASTGGFGYLKDWLWWAGVLTSGSLSGVVLFPFHLLDSLLVGVGEACNFIAYAFAPATLVTPLGALSVLVTSVLSSRLLNERLNLLGKFGCAVCILGSTVIVLHSPKEENVNSMDELGAKMTDITFLIYVGFVAVASFVAIFFIAPKHGQSNILVYIFICSVIGSLSVLGCKGLGLALKETISGNSQLGNWLTWFWLFSVVFCVTTQLNYLNKSLDAFNTSLVTPIYYVLFTSFVILASGVLFNEWVHLGAEDILGNIVGFLTTVIGIFQMTLFRQVNVTWSQLRHLLRRKNIGAPDSQDYTQLDGVVDESFNEGSTLFGNHQNDDDRVIDANTKRSRSEPNGHLGYGQTNNDASDSTQVQLSQMMNA